MKKHFLVVLLVFSTVLIACAHGRKATHKKTAAKKTSATALRGLSAVMMHRGACFGKCPEYTITINSNGLAEYNGTRNAEPLGVYEKNIGVDKAQALLKQFVAYRADTCRSLYTARIPDVPGLYYTLVINGKKQVINNAHFGPRFLVDLSDEVDALGKVDETWKKVHDAAAPE